MAHQRADVVIVGAGIIGSSIALELSKSGRDVVVVDKAGGVGHGSTSASSAVVRFNYSSLDGVALAWESKHCWERWHEHLALEERRATAAFVRTGMVLLDVPIAPREQSIALFEKIGVPYEEWDAADLEANIPGVDVGQYWPPKRVDDQAFYEEAAHEIGGLFTPDAGFVDDPQLAAQNLADAARRHGATFVLNRSVVEVGRRGGRVCGVTLADGSHIESSVVVNAAGPWSAKLNDIAGVGADFAVSLRPMRQEVHQVALPADYGSAGQPGVSIADMDVGTYMRPTLSGHLLIGGTEPECDPLEWIDDPDQLNDRASASGFRAQVTRAARRLSTLRVPNTPSGIAGAYDVTEDWTPIYDRTDLDGFYVAAGTSGNQFKNAPIVGRLMSTLIRSVESGHDHDADPVQFACEYTPHAIDLGAFSRKRPKGMTTTGTVMG